MSNKKLKIYIVTNEYVSDQSFAGGLANYTFKVAQGLLQLGHSPVVVYLQTKVLKNYEVYEGVPLWKIRPVAPIPGRLYSGVKKLVKILKPHSKLVAAFEEFIIYLSYANGVRIFINQQKKITSIDIVHYSNLQGVGALHNSKIPSLIRLSSFRDLLLPFGFEHTSCIERVFENRSIKRADVIIAPSSFVAGYVANLFKRPVSIIPTPFLPKQKEIDLISVPQLRVRPYALFYGSLAEWKGIRYLVAALKDFFLSHSDIDFIFIGNNNGLLDGKSGTEFIEEELQQFQGRFEVLPAMRHQELFRYIHEASFVCFPSLADNFPNVVLEAMYLKKCIIACKGSGMDEQIIHGENGFLVPAGDSMKLAQAMEMVASMSHEDVLKIGQQAFESLSRFTLETCCEQLVLQYKIAIQKHQGLS